MFNKSKVVLISDIHIRLFKRHEEYREQFNKLYNILDDILPEFIVIGGDIFHSKNNLSPEVVNLTSELFRNLSKKCEKLIIIAGNHDLLVNNSDRMDSLTPIINNLNVDNIFYLKESRCYEIGDYIWPVWSQLEENKYPVDLKESLEKNKEKKHIGLYHGPLVGMNTDMGYTFEDGTKSYEFDGCWYTLCGDIHKRQVMYTTQKRPVIMVGSFLQQDYGESYGEHGFCLIDLSSDYYEFFDIPSDNGFYTFKISSFNDIEEGDEKLIKH
jgi:DNA repair exonuclease SbcCD nuclease subunit